jgi:hypothetical protein
VSFAVAAGVAAGWARIGGDPQAYVRTALLAFAMGVEATGGRAVAIPELSRTSVVTTTPAQLAIDFGAPGAWGGTTRKRALSVAALLSGAFVGAGLLLRVGLFAPLVASTRQRVIPLVGR